MCANGCENWKSGTKLFNNPRKNVCCEDWKEFSEKNCQFDKTEECTDTAVGIACDIPKATEDILANLDIISAETITADNTSRLMRKTR